jgi:hypothetical protein
MIASRLPLLFLLALLLALAAPAPAQDPTPAPPADGSDGSVEVRIVTRDGAQMDVYLDGRRIGLTPIKLRTPPLDLVLSAGAPGVEPVIHELAIAPGEDRVVTLVDRPLSRERFPALYTAMVGAQHAHPQNPHLIVLAASVAQDGDDAARLINTMPKAMQDEPMVLYAAARASLLLGRTDAALELLGRACEAEPRMGGLERVRAQILLGAQGPQAALPPANRAVLLEPANADNFTSRAAIHQALGDLRAAEMDVVQALALRPDDARALRLADELRAARPLPALAP